MDSCELVCSRKCLRSMYLSACAVCCYHEGNRILEIFCALSRLCSGARRREAFADSRALLLLFEHTGEQFFPFLWVLVQRAVVRAETFVVGRRRHVVASTRAQRRRPKFVLQRVQEPLMLLVSSFLSG